MAAAVGRTGRMIVGRRIMLGRMLRVVAAAAAAVGNTSSGCDCGGACARRGAICHCRPPLQILPVLLAN